MKGSIPTARPSQPSLIYRWAAIALFIIASIAFGTLRVTQNIQYEGALWNDLLNFSAPQPFGSRILMPLIATYLVTFTAAPTGIVFALLESTFIALTLLLTVSVLSQFGAKRTALLLTAVFFLLLAFLYLPPSPYPIYYPYDLPAVFFTCLAVSLSLSGRFLPVLLTLCLAAFNRETAIVIPFIYLLVRGDERPTKKVVAGALLLFVLYAAIRTFISWQTRGGVVGSFPLYRGYELRLIRNSTWLANPAHWPVFLSTLGFLPLAWMCFDRYIPRRIRKLGFIALGLLLILLPFGNVQEGRIFGEAVTLLFLPVAAGVVRWVEQQRVPLRERGNFLEHHGGKIIVSVLVLFALLAASLKPAPGLMQTAIDRWEGCVLFDRSGDWTIQLPSPSVPEPFEVELSGARLTPNENGEAVFSVTTEGYRSIVINDLAPDKLRARAPGDSDSTQLYTVPFVVPSDARCANAVLRNWGLSLSCFDP